MKRIIFGLLLTALAGTTNASVLEKGAQFKCALRTPITELTGDSLIVCETMGDIYSFYDKSLVIPASSKLLGKIVGSDVAWSRLVTPNGVTLQFPPSVFNSKTERENRVIEITILENLKIPQ